MTLTLIAVSLNEQPLSQPITANFDARGGTIGRADHNTMALPDPQRHVSRLQAEVVSQGSQYLIRNVGAANPIVVGARTLASGESTVLTGAEKIRIGGYLLNVQLVPDDPTSPLTAPGRPTVPTLPSGAPTAPPPATMSDRNPFADLIGQAGPSRSDPFADLMPAPSGIDPRSAALAQTKPPPSTARLPDDFDPFAAPPPPSAPAPAVSSDPFADLMPQAAAASIDQAFGLGKGDANDDPLATFLAGTPAAASPGAPATPNGLSTDPLALFGGVPPPSPARPTQPDNLSALNAAYRPPPPKTAPPPARAPSSVAAPPASAAAPATPTRPPAVSPAATPVVQTPAVAADAAGLWAALCDGAGVDLPLTPELARDGLRNVGRILRSAVEGTLQLMAVRATTKHELRADVTMIRQRDNNPLKFSPDAKAGLEQLLRPPPRGFLDGPAAMDDAMRDLVGHAIGTVAGMRAAIEGMLDRFAPGALEAKLVGASVLDKVLPSSRKARLWDLYLQHHEAIREEAQEDFHALFGKAFLAAYEQQVERLKRSQRS